MQAACICTVNIMGMVHCGGGLLPSLLLRGFGIISDLDDKGDESERNSRRLPSPLEWVPQLDNTTCNRIQRYSRFIKAPSIIDTPAENLNLLDIVERFGLRGHIGVLSGLESKKDDGSGKVNNHEPELTLPAGCIEASAVISPLQNEEATEKPSEGDLGNSSPSSITPDKEFSRTEYISNMCLEWIASVSNKQCTEAENKGVLFDPNGFIEGVIAGSDSQEEQPGGIVKRVKQSHLKELHRNMLESLLYGRLHPNELLMPTLNAVMDMNLQTAVRVINKRPASSGGSGEAHREPPRFDTATISNFYPEGLLMEKYQQILVNGLDLGPRFPLVPEFDGRNEHAILVSVRLLVAAVDDSMHSFIQKEMYKPNYGCIKQMLGNIIFDDLSSSTEDVDSYEEEQETMSEQPAQEIQRTVRRMGMDINRSPIDDEDREEPGASKERQTVTQQPAPEMQRTVRQMGMDINGNPIDDEDESEEEAATSRGQETVPSQPTLQGSWIGRRMGMDINGNPIDDEDDSEEDDGPEISKEQETMPPEQPTLQAPWIGRRMCTNGNPIGGVEEMNPVEDMDTSSDPEELSDTCPLVNRILEANSSSIESSENGVDRDELLRVVAEMYLPETDEKILEKTMSSDSSSLCEHERPSSALSELLDLPSVSDESTHIPDDSLVHGSRGDTTNPILETSHAFIQAAGEQGCVGIKTDDALKEIDNDQNRTTVADKGASLSTRDSESPPLRPKNLALHPISEEPLEGIDLPTCEVPSDPKEPQLENMVECGREGVLEDHAADVLEVFTSKEEQTETGDITGDELANEAKEATDCKLSHSAELETVNGEVGGEPTVECFPGPEPAPDTGNMTALADHIESDVKSVGFIPNKTMDSGEDGPMDKRSGLAADKDASGGNTPTSEISKDLGVAEQHGSDPEDTLCCNRKNSDHTQPTGRLSETAVHDQLNAAAHTANILAEDKEQPPIKQKGGGGSPPDDITLSELLSMFAAYVIGFSILMKNGFKWETDGGLMLGALNSGTGPGKSVPATQPAGVPSLDSSNETRLYLVAGVATLVLTTLYVLKRYFTRGSQGL